MPDSNPPLRLPILTRPDPEVLDTLFSEDVDIKTWNEETRLPYGTPHPDQIKFAGFSLVREEVIDFTRIRRWWTNTPANQNWYNYDLDFGGADVTIPVFTRRYLFRRDQFTALGGNLSFFRGIYLIRVTAGGAGYTETPTVTISGGTGSGGTARALVNFTTGQVAWVLIVTEGSYTVAPNVVFTGGGGAGATATVVLQGEGRLVSERLRELPSDDPRRSLYVAVERRYETFPGVFEASISGYEDETGASLEHYRQRVILGDTTPPAFGEEYVTGYAVLDAKLLADPDNPLVGWLIIDVMQFPDSREEYRGENYPTPDFWVPITPYDSWPIPPAYPACHGGPYQNRTDHLDSAGNSLTNDINHRGTYEFVASTPASPMKDTISYYTPANSPGALPSTFYVTSQPSRFFPIGRNCIHDAITVTFTDSGSGGEVVVENLRASTPSTYTDGETVIDASERQWKGPFLKRVVTSVEFPPLPNQ